MYNINANHIVTHALFWYGLCDVLQFSFRSECINVYPSVSMCIHTVRTHVHVWTRALNVTY